MLNKARKLPSPRERGGDEHWSELQENHETVLNNAFCWGDLMKGVFKWQQQHNKTAFSSGFLNQN